mgnify:CR=1 FL=1
MAAFRLIPKEEKFFADFIALADRIVSGATLLEKMLATDPPAWEMAIEIKQVEEACDSLTHEIIQRLNPVLRGWGNYFKTGNAATKFVQVDRYVTRRLTRFMMKRANGRPRAGQLETWTQDFFQALGLHTLRGTIQYPEAA